MSKLFILILLAAFLIPAGAFAASSDSSLVAINATGGTCILGTGNTAPCGMMNTGTASGSCSNGSAGDCDDGCSCGMTAGSKGTFGTSCSSETGENRGTLGRSSCGIMGGSWGQATAGGAGRYGWAALGFILVITLIIIWIIVGILLILNLYRKLSLK